MKVSKVAQAFGLMRDMDVAYGFNLKSSPRRKCIKIKCFVSFGLQQRTRPGLHEDMSFVRLIFAFSVKVHQLHQLVLYSSHEASDSDIAG